MKLDPHEEGFVGAFIARDRRDRVRGQLRHHKRRRKYLDRLNHTPDLDDRFASRVPRAEQHAPEILALLRARGAPDACFAISGLGDLDGAELSLEEALSAVVGRGVGTILSCIPGRLAYYEGEEPGDRFLLERAGS